MKIKVLIGTSVQPMFLNRTGFAEMFIICFPKKKSIFQDKKYFFTYLSAEMFATSSGAKIS